MGILPHYPSILHTSICKQALNPPSFLQISNISLHSDGPFIVQGVISYLYTMPPQIISLTPVLPPTSFFIPLQLPKMQMSLCNSA